MNASASHPLRPFLPADTMALRELVAASIEELCQEDYDEDQRAAWAGSLAEDKEAFARRLAQQTTLIVEADGERMGFGSLKDNKTIDLLYVHPFHAGDGVGTAICDALEKIAAARGAAELSVDASETAVIFFEGRGYVATTRNSVPIGGEWLSNTTMRKPLKASEKATPPEKAKP